MFIYPSPGIDKKVVMELAKGNVEAPNIVADLVNDDDNQGDIDAYYSGDCTDTCDIAIDLTEVDTFKPAFDEFVGKLTEAIIEIEDEDDDVLVVDDVDDMVVDDVQVVVPVETKIAATSSNVTSNNQSSDKRAFDSVFDKKLSSSSKKHQKK